MIFGFIILTFLTVDADKEAQQTAEKLQKTYQKLGNVQSEFSQTYIDTLRGSQRVESGELWVHKDGRLRWSYKNPTEKDFIFDGKSAFFYEPENRQVTIFDKFQEDDLWKTMQFLWGKTSWKERFNVEACPKICREQFVNYKTLTLIPKKVLGSLDHAWIIIDPKTHRISQALLFDALENKNIYEFKNIRTVATFKNTIFQFVIPEGTSILRATANDNEETTAKPPAPENIKIFKRPE